MIYMKYLLFPFKLLGIFLARFNTVPFIRFLGISICKTSLLIAIKIIVKLLPETKSIYLATTFNDRFIPGNSDIDIFIITKNIPAAEELNYGNKYLNCHSIVKSLFPFIDAYDCPMFVEDFSRLQSLEHTFIYKFDRRLDHMSLIYGEDLRAQYCDYDTELFGFGLFYFFALILVDIYSAKLLGKNQFRTLYNNSINIIRCFFIYSNKREAINCEEYQTFLTNSGIPYDFINILFNMPRCQYKTNEDQRICILYGIISILEKLSDESNPDINQNIDFNIINNPDFNYTPNKATNNFTNIISKDNLYSIYLTRSPFDIESYNLYLIYENTLSYSEFHRQTTSVLQNLYVFTYLPDILKLRCWVKMYFNPLNVFPFIVTKKLINFAKFINSNPAHETVNLNEYGKCLFGKQFKLAVPVDDIRRPYRYNVLYNTNNDAVCLDSFINFAMMVKLLTDKNKLCLTNTRQEYLRHFPGINFEDPAEKYLLARKLVKEYFT